MSSSTSFARRPAPPKYRVRAQDVSKVLCHRTRHGSEQYLIRWKSVPELPTPPRAICSWHPLEQLTQCLHLVQTYIDTRNPIQTPHSTNAGSSASRPVSLKRKAPGGPPRSRDSGLPTPGTSHGSREASVISISSSEGAASSTGAETPDVYNGVLQRKEGYIIAKKARASTMLKACDTLTFVQSRDPDTAKVNATKLPDAQMREEAATAPVKSAERLIREAFYNKLGAVPGVRLENEVDSSTPSLDFTFIKEFVLRDGVYRADPETNEGCGAVRYVNGKLQQRCMPDMGQGIGCEYTKLCTCLEFAAVDEKAFQASKPKEYEEYIREKQQNPFLNTAGLPKRFPYQKPKDDRMPSTLQAFYRDERHAIYECNPNCNCGPVCKSRVVQKGRKVPLTIFKTPNRGWGVYCDEELVIGEFIDTYIGEVITNEETDRREAKAGKDKASYLYSLDKFVGDTEELTNETCFVVDGQYMGGPTRFINHSCEPNCRQYTVSYNKHDSRVYDLAFFAIENIPAGTELTFDYMDKDEEEEEDVLRKREAAARDPDNHDKKPCNCGAKKCRGCLWV